MLEIGTLIYGFCVKSVTALPDVEGRMWRMTYEKNGAELVWLERKDDVKTFVIAFKTLPEDDTGVAHILEHSVLSGSGKYPVKSPFDELRKSSLRVFMNAMTGRDRTYYPFSTRNNQDFLNLADVYLDAVFDPNVLRSPLAFRQEGWHYEIDEATGNLSYNGVVYNEMKGVFADPERAASRDVLHYLYPDTVYGNDSGGKPEAIPNLTYEKFCAFYKKYYHPSNARIFLDGSVDLPSILEKLDGYLKRYDRSDDAVVIPIQKPVSCRKQIKYPSSECERKTILVDAWSVGNSRDVDRRAMLDVLEYYLAGSNESPIKKALLAEGLCEDVQLYWYGYQQLPMVLVVRNTTDEMAAKCREVVRKTLIRLVDDGLDKKRLHAIINKNEFAEREINTSRPRGLAYFSRAMAHWFYGGDPAAEFDISRTYSRLRQGVDAGLFEKCLKEMLIDNSHHVELTFSPDISLKGVEDKRVEDEIARKKSMMSEAEVLSLKKELEELLAYQNREDSKSAKSTIPSLRVSDIPSSGRIVDHVRVDNEDFVAFKTKPTSKGIVYFTVYFPIDDLNAAQLVKVPLLARLLGKLPTCKHDVLSLQTELMSTVGRVEYSTLAEKRGNFLRVKVATLASKDMDTLNLMKEVLCETRFDDISMIAKVHKQKLLSAERNVRTRGDHISKSVASRQISRRWASDDVLHGLEQLKWLQNTEITTDVAKELGELARKIFAGGNIVISYTDNMSTEAASALKTMFNSLDIRAKSRSEISFADADIEAIEIDGDTGYSGTISTLPDGCLYNGSMAVAAKIISLEYLYKEIREKGGAYGTGMTISPSGRISAYTYRNPTPLKSFDVIVKSGDALRSFLNSDRELDRYIVATIAGMDPYLPPQDEAFELVELYMAGRSFKDKESDRKQVTGIKREKLLMIADMLDSCLKNSKHFVVGGLRQIKDVSIDKVVKLESVMSR